MGENHGYLRCFWTVARDILFLTARQGFKHVEAFALGARSVRTFESSGRRMFAILKLLFKCKQCGNCCNISRSVMSDEVEAIAKATGRTFCEVDTKLNQYPCGYLDEKNLCSIHYIKPFCCKHYPRCDAYDNCPGYKELADKIYVEGAMHRVCNDKELSQLYTNVVLTGDLESAYKILDKLNIKL